MYAYFEGRLAHLEASLAIIDCNGVGYALRIPLTTYDAFKGTPKDTIIKLYAHQQVSEDSQLLYGFATEEDKLIFQTLISASGVGPAIGLTALSQLSGQELASAVATANLAVLQRIKGLGAKTAQKLTIELKTKMLKLVSSSSASHSLNGSGWLPLPPTNRQEALTALTTLGVPKATAEKQIEAIEAESGTALSVEELIRKALRSK
jgi:holliday junction DNA helicase RuvA